MPMNRRKFLTLATIGTLAVNAISGCFWEKKEPIQTQETIKALALFAAGSVHFKNAYVIISDKSYKSPNTKWLQSTFYKRFHADLFDKGIIKWDAKFDCDKYAKYFTSLLQIDYFVENFYSREDSESLAVGEIYYNIKGEKGNGHAINIVYSNGGFLFFEPQTGKYVELSAAEVESVFFIKF